MPKCPAPPCSVSRPPPKPHPGNSCPCMENPGTEYPASPGECRKWHYETVRVPEPPGMNLSPLNCEFEDCECSTTVPVPYSGTKYGRSLVHGAELSRCLIQPPFFRIRYILQRYAPGVSPSTSPEAVAAAGYQTYAGKQLALITLWGTPPSLVPGMISQK